MEHSHGVDVFILCNTISSTRILSCFVKCGHCFLLFQVFTSGLCFPSSRGGDGVSAGGPWARHSAVRGSEPLPSFPCIRAPLCICPVSRRWAPWPLRSPPPPPEQFLLHFLNPGMNPGGPGSPGSRCPHSRCSLQIRKAPHGHTPHLALPLPRLAGAPRVPFGSSLCPARPLPAAVLRLRAGMASPGHALPGRLGSPGPAELRPYSCNQSASREGRREHRPDHRSRQSSW